MNTYELTTNQLLEAYRKIRKNATPEWAVHKIDPDRSNELVVPTIPFVGKQYVNRPKKILVYASAENLTNYCAGEQTDRPWLDDDFQAENRHRKCFDDPQLQKNPIIPYVHCGPMDTGLLLTAVLHIASKLDIFNFENLTLRDFCESIAFGNYGKYSIETAYQLSSRRGISVEEAKKVNLDYAGNIGIMEASHSFIKADIETLKPDYIIIPSKMYGAAKLFVDSIKGDAIIIPIMQMLAGNVNNHIAPNSRRKTTYKKYSIEELPPVVQMSYNGMTDVNRDNYLYVFGYLDQVLSSLNTNQ